MLPRIPEIFFFKAMTQVSNIPVTKAVTNAVPVNAPKSTVVTPIKN